MSALSGVVIGAVKRVGKSLLSSGRVPLYWSKCANWGDALNPFLVERISCRVVKHETNPYCWKNFVIGSILERADRYSTVWGTGLIGVGGAPREVPAAIHAVRGPLTRAQLMRSGIKCPDVYGDPALLLPRFLRPELTKKWKVGVIPHYSDREHPWIQQLSGEQDVLVIDVYSDVIDFVRQLVSCHAILSSSLHGLICADAYGVPNRRVILHEDPRIGGEFKFGDYYGGINVEPQVALRPRAQDSAVTLATTCVSNVVDVDLDKLLHSCPFNR
jgi:pyruvyltransferase